MVKEYQILSIIFIYNIIWTSMSFKIWNIKKLKIIDKNYKNYKNYKNFDYC